MSVTTASTPCTELLDTAITTGQLGRDPYPIYASLRERDPVCRSNLVNVHLEGDALTKKNC